MVSEKKEKEDGAEKGTKEQAPSTMFPWQGGMQEFLEEKEGRAPDRYKEDYQSWATTYASYSELLESAGITDYQEKES